MTPRITHAIDADVWDWGTVQVFFFTLEYWRWSWAIERYEYDYEITGKFTQWDITLPTMAIRFLVER